MCGKSFEKRVDHIGRFPHNFCSHACAAENGTKLRSEQVLQLLSVTSTKKCFKCAIVKPLSEFNKMKGCKFGVRPTCRSCRSLERDPSTTRRNNLRKYGLTEQEYQVLKASQNNSCKICNEVTTKLVVDHCHTTGRNRGLLCSGCSTGIGFLKESEALMLNAIKYLKESAHPDKKS